MVMNLTECYGKASNEERSKKEEEVLLASNTNLSGKIFCSYAGTYENYNNHNYLLLHFRSILALSITCLVLV